MRRNLFQLFMEELADMYSAENQIIDALPKMIKWASFPDLRDALIGHLEETENQVARLERIFSILDAEPTEKWCAGMAGILEEAESMAQGKTKSAILDATIICGAQKVEHYEMASYGTMRSFAKHLDLDSEIIDLLQESLDEEGAADKKLTKIADGSLFSSGVNREAALGGRKRA